MPHWKSLQLCFCLQLAVTCWGCKLDLILVLLFALQGDAGSPGTKGEKVSCLVFLLLIFKTSTLNIATS